MPIKKSVEKDKAHYLYFNTSKSQKEIADIVEVSERTMCLWVKSGNWAEHKKAMYYSTDQETHFLYEELREIDNNIRKRPQGERFGTKQEIETKTKILNLIMGPLKNTADKWRNIAHEIDIEEEDPDFKPRGFNIIIDGIDPKDVPDF